MRLEGLKDNPKDPPMGELIGIVSDASQEVRSIAHQMMPKALSDLGLAPAIDEMLKRSFSDTDYSYQYEHHCVNGNIPDDVSIGIYRITQELISNIIKHADARSINVQLLKASRNLVLMVEDDGKGIDVGSISKGLGLQNINDRARSMNGTFQIEPGPEKGTVASLRVPLTD